ncbi:MAG: TonB-dependent receptor [candidate division KSB1 bacterium]|nr:TonB-dependent receptor [candidate division KSB1 bacterium]MDZ7318987.1 TonB-dependent receptor [candidate division KSB1 bacterium]
MKIHRMIATCLLAVAIMLCSVVIAEAQRGQISGRVTDSESGKALPGANIFLKGTSLGAASDLNGYYVIPNVPPGTYTITVSYIGYEAITFTVQINLNENIKRDVKLKPQAVRGETVTVTAQAEAQLQAINQQLSAKTVTNIVSSKQIQELPEANAAEAVGRLPGVSLERSGGEGNKVVIRGMAAKYSIIQIDGVNMTATGEEDRSTDLSMISPYMLEGIELTKSVMANQEATATGGIVNFRIRKAPEGLAFNLISQGGYNSLRNSYRDFKISAGASNRFYANLLGVYAQVDYEEKDAGSQQLGGVSFFQENETAPVKTNSVQLMDIFRNVKRLGGALVLDYGLQSTTLKSSNFFSRINREETRFQNNYDFTQQGFSLNYSDTPKSWLTVLTNSFQIDHRWRNWEINSLLSHSYSENILPARIGSTNNNSPTNPFSPNRKSNFNVDLDPETIPDSLIISMDEAVQFMHLGRLDHDESETRERDLAGELNLSYNFNITDWVNIKLSLGGKYTHKSKEYDRTYLYMANDGGNQEYRNLIYEAFENELSTRTKDAWAKDNMRILLIDFLDQNYKGGKFLNGRYDFGHIFDKEKFRRIHDLCMDTYDPANVKNMYDIVLPDFVNSTYYDYHGTEDYHAFYLMPEINFGPRFLFVPGVRYEAERTEYTGYRGSRLGVLRGYTATPVDTVTKVRKNEFVLPMIQTFYKPTHWLTFKAGYTNTLQRPNYNNIMPGWVISNQGQIDNLSNFRLRPELSRNWDIQMSLHSNKIGLFSMGAFYKKITDMIFWTGQKAITDTAFFELPTIMNRQRAAWATNNDNPAYNYGFETEWQSNLWYLPGLLKGLVVNVNYTYNKSEAKYLRTRIKLQVDPRTYKTTLVNEDTTYTSPMISQPKHLLNLTLGYDYRGFSIRWAMRYHSHIFKSANWYEELRGYSTPFYRYDLQIRQKLPLKGLEFFINVNNLTDELERDVINHMNFANYIEDYGRNANMGLRYKF